ncbi:MAG: M20/M25/M40 family metallo-hydrolase [Pseudohongiellaceae bacterium]
MQSKSLLIGLAFCSALNSCANAQLSDTEKKLSDYIDTHHSDAIALLEKVVNINSGTQNFAGVAQVGAIFRDEFDKLGMETEWIEGASWNRAGHLVAQNLTGNSSAPHLLLIGHLDTVFQSDSPFQSYQYLGDNIASGPGIADMKGGDVIILQALSALHDQGLLETMNVTVYMTGDEESSGDQVLARAHMQSVAESADIALGFENGDGNPATAIPARRGFASWELRIKGIPAHSSQIFQPEVGAGAIFELSRILNRFYQELSEEEYLTFNPGVIMGGTELNFDSDAGRGDAFGLTNVVSQDAIARGDLRMISNDQTERARAAMNQIVSENLPLTNAEFIFDPGMPPFPDSEGNRLLLEQFSQASQDLGFGEVTAVDPSRAGAADISYVGEYVTMAIDGMGMGGANDHTVNETGDLESLRIQAKRAAVLMYRLSTN